MEVTTGLPQGSPVSPVLFALYIADIHQAVESQMEDCRGISFVDDITWVVEGTDLNDVIAKLEGCARASLEWAEDNAVRFETSKTAFSFPGAGSIDGPGASGRLGLAVRGFVSPPTPPGGWVSGLTQHLHSRRTGAEELARHARRRPGSGGSSTNTAFPRHQPGTSSWP